MQLLGGFGLLDYVRASRIMAFALAPTCLCLHQRTFHSNRYGLVLVFRMKPNAVGPVKKPLVLPLITKGFGTTTHVA